VKRYASGWLWATCLGLLLLVGSSCARNPRISRTWPIAECPTDEIGGVWLAYRGGGVFEVAEPDEEQVHVLGLDENGIMWVGAIKLCAAQRGEVIEEINRLAD